ncbi:MAG TPA: hypothetical protein VEK07_25000 [Polyangiaceae bacterium]|nr:hypothetical protein [Polyangiaceae bacterium]
MSYGIWDARRQAATPRSTIRAPRKAPIAVLAVAVATIVVLGGSRDARVGSPRREASVAAASHAPRPSAFTAAKVADEGAYAFRREAGGSALSADVGAEAGVEAAGVARVDRSGLSWAPRSGAFQVTFATRRYGCAGALVPVAQVAPARAEGRRTRVDERAGSAKLEEWAVSGPSGLEQGWNIGASACASGQLEIEVGVAGLAATARPRGGAVDLRDASGVTRLHYDRLSARDASGAPLAARMTTRDDAIVLAIDARGAKFPIVVDPAIWSSPTQFVPGESECANSQDEMGGENFGVSVAISGSNFLVGAEQAGGVNGTGDAYFFIHQPNGTWESDEVNGADSVTGDAFGWSVAISGNLAVIGAENTVNANGGHGAAYVFTFSNGIWLQEAKLTPSDTPTGFGTGVATDGTTIVVAAYFSAEAYIFTSPSAGVWTQSAMFTDSAGEGFGQSIAVSGGTVLVGAPFATNGSTSDVGTVSVYEGSGSTWALSAKLTPPASDVTSELNFGDSVATNGTMAFVGAASSLGSGAVYTYTQAGSGWSGPTVVQPQDVVSGGDFGSAMSLSGNLLAVAESAAEKVYVLPISNGVLSSVPLVEATSPDGQTDEQFGFSIGLDSNNLVVGANLWFGSIMGSSDMECGEVYLGPVLLTDGTACTSGPACESGICASAGSVCCNVACSGSCATCASGTCAVLSAGSVGSPSCGGYLCNGTSMTCPTSCQSDTNCANGYYCGGDAACHPQLGQGTTCNTSAGASSGTCAQAGCRECASGNCTDGVCCSSAQCGTCQACAGSLQAPGGTNGACSPSTLDTDPHHDCGSASTCDGAGACGLKNGQPATSANQCASGWLADNVCCQTSCSGACDVCTAALGSTGDGTCGPAPAGSAGNPACGSGVACNGTAGTCPGASCTSDTACVTGFYCGSGGTCQPQKVQGTGCNTATGGDCSVVGCRECAGGNSCVDSVCCGSTSCPTCQACAAGLQASGGTNGMCSPALSGSNPHGACDAGSTCNGASSCALENGQPSTAAAACVSGYVVDGVCCDQACEAACDVCTAALGATKNGTCTTLVCAGDAGPADASSDAEVSDAAPDAARDAQAVAEGDGGLRDASVADATVTAVTDAAASAGDASGFFERERPSCSCRTAGRAGTESPAAGAAGLAVLALAAGRRRRRGRRDAGRATGRARTEIRRRGERATVLAGSLVLACATSAHTASADSDEQRATARILATQGFKAFQEQRWADVVDRFGRAESLVHAPPHLLYLARGYVHLGKLVAAHETYEKLTREVLPPSASRVAVQAQVDGAKELAELAPRVPSLTITVTPAASNATVTIDGAVLASAMIGAEVPIDPGSHTIEAKARGFVEARQTVNVAEASHSSARLELRPAPAEAVATGGTAGVSNAATAALMEKSTAGDRRSNPSSSSALRIGGYAASAVAVAAAGAGVVLLLESHRERVDGDALCPMSQCPDSDRPQIDSLDQKATLFGQLGVAAFVTAGVAAATGVTLIILSSGKGNMEPAGLWIGPGSAGLRGTF